MIAGRCAPVSDDDCNRPNGACEELGECHLQDDGFGARCVSLSDADCKGSKICASGGACSFDAALGQCDALTAADCRDSLVCTELDCCNAIGGDCAHTDGTCYFDCCSGAICHTDDGGGG
jgi:hypothetical protein